MLPRATAQKSAYIESKTTLADDEIGRQHDHPPTLTYTSCDAVEEQLRCDGAEGLGGLSHDGEERVEARDVLDVVEAHERELPRDLDASLACRFDDADGDDVVHREDRRRRLLEVEEAQGSFVAAARIDRARLHHVAGPLLDRRRLERVPEPLQSLSRRRDVE